MKVRKMRFIKVFTLFAAVIISVVILQNSVFFYWDANALRVKSFYMEEKNSLDVVLLGSSEIYNDFAPGQAFEEYGFTSHPFAMDSNSAMMIPYELDEIYERQNPQLLVIEINSFLYDEDEDTHIDVQMRRYLDSMPRSMNRIRTICATFDRSEWFEHLFPFMKYHDNWSHPKRLADNMIEKAVMESRGYSLLKGAITWTKKIGLEDRADIKKNASPQELTDLSEVQLRKTLDYLTERNITNVLFVRFPHPITDDEYFDFTTRRYSRCLRAGEIIREYGYEFLNFESDDYEMGIDYAADFYNNDHMNVFGQKKFTRFLSEILLDYINADKSKLSDELLDEWERAARATNQFYAYCLECFEKQEAVILAENNTWQMLSDAE